MHGKLILISLIIILIAGIILAIARCIPAIANVFSQHLLNEFVVDLPVKLAIGAPPFILLLKSSYYTEWETSNPNLPISKKDFVTGNYLNIFVSVFVGVPVLVAIWIIAVLADNSVIENILTIGVFNLGAMFFLMWMMTALVFTLQFTKIKDSIMLVVSLYGSLLTTVGLQSLLSLMEIPFAHAAVICTFIGLIIFILGWAITVRLYEKVDL